LWELIEIIPHTTIEKEKRLRYLEFAIISAVTTTSTATAYYGFKYAFSSP
jgi:hypothetical protein